MDELLVRLKALAHETRFKIINLLIQKSFCVGALAQQLGLSEGAVSQHLKILREACLVKGEKRGYWTHYQVETAVLEQVADELKQLISQPLYTWKGCKGEHTPHKHCCRKEGEDDVQV